MNLIGFGRIYYSTFIGSLMSGIEFENCPLTDLYYTWKKVPYDLMLFLFLKETFLASIRPENALSWIFLFTIMVFKMLLSWRGGQWCQLEEFIPLLRIFWYWKGQRGFFRKMEFFYSLLFWRIFVDKKGFLTLFGGYIINVVGNTGGGWWSISVRCWCSWSWRCRHESKIKGSRFKDKNTLRDMSLKLFVNLHNIA